MIENQVGDKIRLVRKQNGLSQEEFAFRIGVSKQTISSWELGTAQPGFEKIKLICIQFKIDANEFVYAQNDNHIVKPAPEVEVVADKAVVDINNTENIKSDIVNSRDKKITFIFVMSIWILLFVIIAVIAFSMVTINLDDFDMSISMKTSGIAIAISILVIINILLTITSIVIYFMRKNSKMKNNIEEKNK